MNYSDTTSKVVNGSSTYYQNGRFSNSGPYFTFVETLIASFGLLFNLIVIVFLIQLMCRGPIKATLKFVLSLAICDGYIAFVHILRPHFALNTIWDKFLTYTFTHKYTFFDGVVCPFIVSYVYMGTQTVALETMMFIAVDLLILVKWPLRYVSIMSSRKASVLVISSWMISCLLWTVICIAFESNVSRTVKTIAMLAFNCTCLCLPIVSLVVFVVLYAIILCGIKRFIAGGPSGRNRTLAKAVVTVACVFATYVICNMPYLWIVLGNNLLKFSSAVFLIDFLRCLFVLNSLCDPIIYSVRLPELRAKFRYAFDAIKKGVWPQSRDDSCHMDIAEMSAV